MNALVQRVLFRDSAAYWERRYRRGGTSGAGSYGAQAAYKAEFLNALVRCEGVESVVELGCGDGNQLSLASYPRYLGLDVSELAVRRCSARFAGDRTKSFLAYRPDGLSDPAGFIRADLALSLDVIYHLVEDDVFDRYMRLLFGAGDRLVAAYATDRSGPRQAPHVRHRRFTDWVAVNEPAWSLSEIRPRPADGYQDFFVFRREGERP